MSAEKVVYTLLAGAAGVTALVGTRIYADVRPEDDALPALVYETVSDVPTSPIDITAGSEPCAARIQVNCLATTPEARKTLAAAVVAALHKKSGSIGGVTVMSALQAGSGPSVYDASVETYSQPIDFIVNYLR